MNGNFTELRAWQKAHRFVLHVYTVISAFPECERFALSDQFRRASISIAANIAEGYKKLSKADKLRFMNIAQGSIEECRYYIILSFDLGYVSEEQKCVLNQEIEDASRLLNAYCKKVKESTYADCLG